VKDVRRKVVRSGNTHADHRRASAAVGRLLKRLHVRGLIAKIPHSRRWKVTETGRRVLGQALIVYRRDWTQTETMQAI
jgi:ribosomal protein S19E (S16A)